MFGSVYLLNVQEALAGVKPGSRQSSQSQLTQNQEVCLSVTVEVAAKTFIHTASIPKGSSAVRPQPLPLSIAA